MSGLAIPPTSPWPGREASPSRRQHRECALIDGGSDLSPWLVFQHGIADGRALAPDGGWMSAEPTARFPGGGPQLDTGHGGLGENGKVNIPYMWLEFGSAGIRLRGRRPVGRVVTPRDIPYSDITQLVVLAAPAGPRQRGIRLRTVGQPQYVYFFARPAVVQQLVEQFSSTVSGSTVSSLLTVFPTVAAPGSTEKARTFNRTANEPPTAATGVDGRQR